MSYRDVGGGGDFTVQQRVFPDHCEDLLVRGRGATNEGLLHCGPTYLNFKNTDITHR